MEPRNTRKGVGEVENSSSLELGIRPLRVVATHREATKHPCQGIAFGDSLRSGDMSDREAEFENGIGDCSMRGFDRFEIGREDEI
jgi:hypothetical protein